MSQETAIRPWPAKKVLPSSTTDSLEDLVVEEPLEIALEYSTNTGRMRKNITVTLRTPGKDAELALGFLFGEGIINGFSQVDDIIVPWQNSNRILVVLKENEKPDLQLYHRNFLSTSSCGICGKSSAESLYRPEIGRKDFRFKIPSAVLYGLPRQLSEMQQYFSRTGGIHAAALLDSGGAMTMMQEDIGRHNALDKIIGASLQLELDLKDQLLLLSGRAGFELVQKAVRAGIGFVAAIGAPSSMAVDMAVDAGLTLVGFLRADRYTVYSNASRIVN